MMGLNGVGHGSCQGWHDGADPLSSSDATPDHSRFLKNDDDGFLQNVICF